MTVRQLALLKEIQRGVSVDDALMLNQTTFGSVCYQKWVMYEGMRFHLSHAGRLALSENRNLELHRQHNTGKFGKRVRYSERRR